MKTSDLTPSDDHMVTITKDEYEELKECARWLSCLENAGVDNWGGIDFAQDLFRESEENET